MRRRPVNGIRCGRAIRSIPHTEPRLASTSRKVEQGRATREAMLAAARELFGTHGYADTSADDIVRGAGVTKGAFYHHFAGKQEAFLRVFEEVKKELSRAAFVVHIDHEKNTGAAGEAPRAEALKPIDRQDNATVWSDLHASCRKYIELHTDPAIRRIVLVDARWVLPWDELQRIENDYGAVILRADLRRAMNRGLVQRLPLRSLAMILTGALNEACILVANAPEPEHALGEAIEIVGQLIEGLRDRTADAHG